MDVFLSYARADIEVAKQLAERLEREGFSVFYDVADLSAGDSLDSLIVRTLRSARAIVVIWTEHSVGSSWVRMQAEQAVRLSTYVPLVVGAEPHIPYAFAHFPAATSFDQVVQVVQRQLAPKPNVGAATSPGAEKPEPRTEPAQTVLPIPRSLRELQLASIYWIGIGSAVLTLAGNLDSFIKLARWVRLVLSHWAEILTLIWRTLIPWRIQINAEDAVVLTLLVVLFFNLLITSRHKDVAVRIKARDPLLLASGALLIGYLGFVGFADRHDNDQAGLISRATAPLVEWLSRQSMAAWSDAASFVTVLALGVVAMLLAYLPFALMWSIRPNVNAYAIRLWRILAGVAAAIVINQVSLFLESPEWSQIINT